MRGGSQDEGHRSAIDIDSEDEAWNKANNAPIEEEDVDPANTQCFGFNVLKVARYLNLLVGLGICVGGVLSLLNVFEMAFDLFLYPGALIMNLFLM